MRLTPRQLAVLQQLENLRGIEFDLVKVYIEEQENARVRLLNKRKKKREYYRKKRILYG